MKKQVQTSHKLIIYILVFTILLPIFSGFVFINPAYAAGGLTENKGFMSMVKGLLMLFFFSFISKKDETSEYLEDSYQDASQEESNSEQSSSQGSSYQRISVTDKDREILAKAVYSESRGEPFEGQVAVASVVINRVLSSEFPNDVTGVVFEKPGGNSYAFSAVLDGQIYLTPNETAYKAVDYALNGWDPSEGALYYYNPVTATANWIFQNTTPRITIGNHVFADLKR